MDYLAGAVGGITVVLLERLLFRARSSWEKARRSREFLRSKWDQWRASLYHCPECSRKGAQLGDPPREASRVRGNEPEWHLSVRLNLRCPHCGHEWREVVGREELK